MGFSFNPIKAIKNAANDVVNAAENIGDAVVGAGKAAVNTAQDIFDLPEEVIARVKAHGGITLEREVIFIGDFKPWPRPG